MSARKAKRRPKAPRLREIAGRRYDVVKGMVEIEGHRLTDAQVAQLERYIFERHKIAMRPGSSIPDYRADNYAHDVGFDDLLCKFKATSKAKERIAALSMDVSTVATSIAGLSEYSFYDAGPVRDGGCALLHGLIEEAERRLSRLKHFATSMSTQSATKLQDWVAREEEFQKIGEGAQS